MKKTIAVAVCILTIFLTSCSLGQVLKDDEIETHGLGLDGKPAVVEKATGKVIVPTTGFYNIGSFSEGLCVVQNSGGHGFIDTAGKLVIPYQFDRVGDFHEGMAYFEKNNSKTKGFIDTDGDEVFNFDDKDYEGSPDYSFANGLALVRKKVKKTDDYTIGAIDKKGKLVIPIEYRIERYGFRDDFKDGKIEILTGSRQENTFKIGTLYIDGTVKWADEVKK